MGEKAKCSNCGAEFKGVHFCNAGANNTLPAGTSFYIGQPTVGTYTYQVNPTVDFNSLKNQVDEIKREVESLKKSMEATLAKFDEMLAYMKRVLPRLPPEPTAQKEWVEL